MNAFNPRRDEETDLMQIDELSREYSLAFQLLDEGYPLPVDLEAALDEQGYIVPDLYALFND